MKAAKRLSEVCRYVGARAPEWTQATGGNISVKEGADLLIKASGARLDAVSEENGIACVKRAEITLASESTYQNFLKKGSRARPSMETGFHAGLPKKWVIHIHSLAGILIADLVKNDKSLLAKIERRFGGSFACLGHFHPGLDLALACEKVQDKDVILVENHGVILQGDDDPLAKTGILHRWQTFERAFCEERGYEVLARFLASEGDAKLKLTASLQPAPWTLLFPDLVVFEAPLRAHLEPAESGSDFYRWRNTAGKRQANFSELWWAVQILYAENPKLHPLSQSFCDRLRGMESEEFRKKAVG